MEATARAKYLRNSPKKMRVVVNAIRKLPVQKALNTLHFMPQAAAREIETVLKSAVHNLIDMNREERLSEESMVIKEIFVDQAPVFKRFRPAPRGRAHRIRKRNSHLTVIVGVNTGDEEN